MTQQMFFDEVIRSLERLRIPYMLTGSVAAMIYGEPRMTNDLDVVVRLAPRHVRPLIDAFAGEEYYVPPSETIMEEIEHRGQINIIHVESGSKVDLVICKDTDFAQEEFSRREPAPWQAGGIVQSATPEDIILSKLQAYRMSESEKHVSDIIGMLRVSRGSLDMSYLDLWVARLGVEAPWRDILRRTER